VPGGAAAHRPSSFARSSRIESKLVSTSQRQRPRPRDRKFSEQPDAGQIFRPAGSQLPSLPGPLPPPRPGAIATRRHPGARAQATRLRPRRRPEARQAFRPAKGRVANARPPSLGSSPSPRPSSGPLSRPVRARHRCRNPSIFRDATRAGRDRHSRPRSPGAPPDHPGRQGDTRRSPGRALAVLRPDAATNDGHPRRQVVLGDHRVEFRCPEY